MHRIFNNNNASNELRTVYKPAEAVSGDRNGDPSYIYLTGYISAELHAFVHYVQSYPRSDPYLKLKFIVYWAAENVGMG